VLQKTRAATQHYAELNKAVRNLTEQVAGQEQKLDELRNTYTLCHGKKTDKYMPTL